jgi:peptidoglycan/xylan/chitin deacetylase (PgdA/CDA1 family)
MAASSLLSPLSRGLARLSGTGRAVVLKYHRVLESRDPMRPGETTAEDFDAQMSVVAAHFPCKTFGSFIRGRGTAEGAPNTVVVTFDDGYKDNHDVALPILRKYGVPATIFVASGYLTGGMMWNDRLIEAMRVSVGRHVDLREAGLGEPKIATLEDASRAARETLSAIKRWPQQQRAQFVDDFAAWAGLDPAHRVMLNGAEVTALAGAGIEIGAHTVTHPILSTLSPDEARAEIVQSRVELGRLLGREIATFAYPNGRPSKDFTDADVERVKEAGFSGAATTAWGCASARSDPFRVSRQAIWGSSRARIWYQLLRNFRQ